MSIRSGIQSLAMFFESQDSYKKLVAEFLEAGGPPDDVIVKIGDLVLPETAS